MARVGSACVLILQSFFHAHIAHFAMVHFVLSDPEKTEKIDSPSTRNIPYISITMLLQPSPELAKKRSTKTTQNGFLFVELTKKLNHPPPQKKKKKKKHDKNITLVFGNSPADSTKVTMIWVPVCALKALTKRAEIVRHLYSASTAYSTVFINLQKLQRRCILHDN